MTATLTSHQQATAESLKTQLDDPRVAAALSSLLDHADLLAILIVGLDAMVSRSETIGAALVDGIDDLRDIAAVMPDTEGLNPGEILASVIALSGVLPKVTPAITRVVDAGLVDTVLDSAITSPVVIDQISTLGRALTVGAEQSASKPMHVPGALGLLKLLKDPDINRGMGYLLSVLKALGAELRTTTDQTTP